MSIKSYQKNVERGVAGPEFGVCYPAAIEQLSTRYGYKPEIYIAYEQFAERNSDLSDQEQIERIDEHEAMVETLVRPLGGLALEDVVFRTIATPQGLRRAVNGLNQDGYNIVLDIACIPKDKIPHAVGLMPIEKNYVTLVSTYVPNKLKGVIHLDTVAACLFDHGQAPLKGHPYHTANLTAIPNI